MTYINFNISQKIAQYNNNEAKKGLIKKKYFQFLIKIEIKIFTCEVEFHQFWETWKNRREKINILNNLGPEIENGEIQTIRQK